MLGHGLTGRPALEPGLGGLHRAAHGLDDLRHIALFYYKSNEYLAAIRDFVAAGIDHAEPVLVAVPRDHLPPDWQPLGNSAVSVVDMRQLGQNPARIIPALRAFADHHGGQRVRYLGESVWPNRTAPEQLAAARYESLVNLAFADAQVTMLCLYNAADLPESAIGLACSTHPTLLSNGRERDSMRYLGPAAFPGRLDESLPRPPVSADALAYGRDLRPLRALVTAGAQRAGLDASRCMDLVIAASEVAANTLRHTAAGGVIRVWHADGEVLCQLEDAGYIRDPLAGYHRPSDGMTGGQGLWLVNQVCDLVEIRTGQSGTTIRLHMYLR
jgi:anti-sigma regulatory factor (Ser/Thr protein kinase)